MQPTTDVHFGVDSMSSPLRRVAMRRPGAILTADHDRWHYAGPIEADELVHQFDAFVELLADDGVEVAWLPEGSPGDGGEPGPVDDDLADSIFTYDPSFVVPAGAVLLRPGKPLRSPETDLHDRFYREAGIPVVGRIEAPGTVEGGDCFWIDPASLAVGRGFRTNADGIDQLGRILQPLGIALEVYDLPYHHGPESCLHLLSVISPLDADLALVHAPLLPTALWERLTGAGWDLVAAPPDEFEASAGLSLNVLATGPRRVIAIDGYPATAEALRAAGCRVATFRADALCRPCEGGPTCLTRPLRRDPGVVAGVGG
jgi:N-dimethylarginine dimethylaminohydrolase